MDAHGNSEVELINVARANPLVDGLDLPGVLLFCEGDGGFRERRCFGLLAGNGGPEGGKAGRIAAEKGSLPMVEEKGAAIDTEPG
jgi:hypothetical protein